MAAQAAIDGWIEMWNKFIAALLIGLCAVAPQMASAKRPQLSAGEQQMLPKFCWGRYVDKKYAGVPGHSIPKSCGGAMNHMCPGFMFLVAAQRTTAKPRDRRYNAQRAIAELRYTQRHMTKQCPLRENVETGIASATLLQKTIK